MSSSGYMAAVAALLAGLALGRWAPQADLREARRELEHLRRQPAGTRGGGAAAIQGVQSLLDVKPAAAANRPERRPGSPQPHRAAGTSPATQASSAGDPAADAATTNAAQAAARASFSNELAKVRDAWNLRAEIARSNFVSRVDLDRPQTVAFEAVVEGMNLRLGAAVDAWAERIREQGQMTSEDGVRIMHDVSTALVQSYNEMDRYLPPAWREQAGPRFEIVNFVDPEVLSPLEDVEAILSRDARGGPRRSGARAAPQDSAGMDAR